MNTMHAESIQNAIFMMKAVDGDGDLWLLAPNKGAGPERNLAAVARFETQEFVCRLMPGAAAQSHLSCRESLAQSYPGTTDRAAA